MRLRKKTAPDPSNSSLIKTVCGSSYVFAATAVGAGIGAPWSVAAVRVMGVLVLLDRQAAQIGNFSSPSLIRKRAI
jgi:hypothetical protein